MHIGIVQYDITWQNPPANLKKLDSILEAAKELDLIVLPEMFNTGFSMDVISIAEPMNGITVNWMKEKSAQLDYTLTGSVAIAENGRYYNRFIAARNGEIVAAYDKKNLFEMAGEDAAFSPGDVQAIFKVNEWVIKPLICYDLRFPLWCYNREKSDLMLFVANWPEKRIEHWRTLLKARAIENQAFVIGVNRVGADGNGIMYNGMSMVISPMGEVILDAGSLSGLFTCNIGLDEVISFRKMMDLIK